MSSQSAEAPDRKIFAVHTPPFIHTGRTLHTMMRDTLFALFPAAAMAVYAYGFPALGVMGLSCLTAVGAEALCLRLAKRDVRIDDLTAFVSGLLFAFLLPAGAPWWMVIIGSAISIILGKHVFGGLGCNPLCPPLVGWAALMLSWPLYLDAGAVILNTDLIDPLVRLKYFGPHSLDGPLSSLDLLTGRQLGGLGASQTGLLLMGGLYLIIRHVIRWEIAVSFLAGAFILGGVYWLVDPALYAAPQYYILCGSTIFAAFFLATETASSPVSARAMFLYGLFGGAMVVVIRIYGIYTDGAHFAVLLGNLLAPLLDLWRPAMFGRSKKHA